MNASVTQAIQEIDAAMFSGDEFLSRENITILRKYLSRWRRGLREHRDTLNQQEVEQDTLREK